MLLCSSCTSGHSTTDLKTISGAVILRLLGSQQSKDESDPTFKIHIILKGFERCWYEHVSQFPQGPWEVVICDTRTEVNGTEMEHRAWSSFLRWSSPDTEQPKEVGQEANATLGVMPRRKASHGKSQQSMESQKAIHPQKEKKGFIDLSLSVKDCRRKIQVSLTV